MNSDKNQIYIMDNLDFLKSSKLDNQIKLIYIDPPYNTNSKFVFHDDRTNWEEFITCRIFESKRKLREDGIIFISIDDNKLFQLKLICDNTFGEKNYVGIFITKQSQRSNSKFINIIHEYILCYAKDKSKIDSFKIRRMDIPEDRKMIEDIYKKVNLTLSKYGQTEAQKLLKKKINNYMLQRNISWIKNYSNISEQGDIFFTKDLSVPSNNPKELEIVELGIDLPALKTRAWSSKNKIIDLFNKNKIFFKRNRPYEIHHLYDAVDNVKSILDFYSRSGTKDLDKLGLKYLFDNPKPVGLIKYLVRMIHCNNDIVLDFFGGSGTTAQAIYELNFEDKLNNKYVLVQNKENIKNAKTLSIYPEFKTIDELMIFRIETFCSLNKINSNFELSTDIL